MATLQPFSGVNVVPVTSSIEDNFALPEISEFEKLITDKTRGIVICNRDPWRGIRYLINSDIH